VNCHTVQIEEKTEETILLLLRCKTECPSACYVYSLLNNRLDRPVCSCHNQGGGEDAAVDGKKIE